MKKWSIESKTMAGFILVLALFAGSLAVAFQSSQYLRETNDLVLHTQKVLRELDGTVSAVTSAETGERGYLLTGDEAYLDPYNSALSDVQLHLSNLSDLLADNPDQQTRLASLESLITNRLGTLRQSIDTYRRNGFDAARDVVLSGQGKGEMDSIRNLAGEMQSYENTLLEERSAASEEGRKRSGRTFVLMVIMVVAMLGFVYYLIRRDSKQRRRSEVEIKQLNSDLERRVSERTSELQAANRELQQEVAERTRAEKVLTESEGRFNAFMDNSPALAWLKDERGYYVYANKAFLRGNKLSLEQLSKKTAYDLWPREMAEEITRGDEAVRTSGETTESTLSNAAEDGSPRQLLTFRFPVKDASEQLLIGGVAIDVTERKKAEEALQQAVDELAHSNAELQQFAYVASHDLQEPLRMVASYTQLLAKRYGDKLDEDAHDFIGYAVDGANRMQRLINDLLSYSRLSTKSKPLAPVSSEEVLAGVLDNLRVSIEESGVEVTHDPLPVVMGDDVQLGQLFQNLIGNAIKFKGSGPQQIHIGVKRSENQWLFSVHDNGIGMEPQYADRIFVIFQRLHKAEYPGTGIGLAVCKKVVERHGGRIWVESEPGRGSTFYFTLPQRLRGKIESDQPHLISNNA